MNWKHLKSADRSIETDSQSMSVTQAGKLVKFLLVALLLILVAADTHRLMNKVTSAFLIFNFDFFTIPNQGQNLSFFPCDVFQVCIALLRGSSSIPILCPRGSLSSI